jgi:UDP-GlcNAc:undecaprenyl-phosphate/decaprenyl-phosphate GlcNAc-1-phosphate transferase
VTDVSGPFFAGLAVGFAVAAGILGVRLASPPAALMRINVDGRDVPAVLGDAVIVGSVAALGVLALGAGAGWDEADTGRSGVAVAVLVTVLGVAGRIDDLRGDEEARGFRGHLKAALSGRVTGGFIKILGGGLAGLVAGAIVASGWLAIVLTGAVIALAANLFNLLDRAPGRASKVWLLAMTPLLFVGFDAWIIASAGVVGAAITVVPADLTARGMLGDAGVNPLGAVWGLGLAVATDTPGRTVAAAVLLALNLLSERYSYSEIIDRSPLLRAFDRLGRKKERK